VSTSIPLVQNARWMAPPPGPPPCWYAVHTRSHFEKKLAADLAAKRMETYLPVFEELHQWKDRRKRVQVPIFPGYVFAWFSDCSRTRLEIHRSPGAVRILSQGERPEPIPEDEIESIRRLLAARVYCFPHPFLREGDWVRVTRGPLRDLQGLLVRVKNQTRLVISIALLSQSVATEIDRGNVELARPTSRSRKVPSASDLFRQRALERMKAGENVA